LSRSLPNWQSKVQDRLAELERLHDALKADVALGRGARVAQINADWHWALYESARSIYLNDLIRRLWDSFSVALDVGPTRPR
jgi:DNA-binding GntR family transcriptional regulator